MKEASENVKEVTESAESRRSAGNLPPGFSFVLKSFVLESFVLRCAHVYVFRCVNVPKKCERAPGGRRHNRIRLRVWKLWPAKRFFSQSQIPAWSSWKH